METNGKAHRRLKPSLTPAAVKNQQRVAEARAEIQAIVAERHLRRLKESAVLDFDYLGPWREVLNSQQIDPGWYPIGSQSSRRYGTHFPFFQTEQQLALIRDLSRIVLGTSNHAKGLMRGYTSFVIGTGYKFKVTPKKGTDDAGDGADTRVTAFLDEWARRNRWYERQQELFRRTNRCGDGIMVMDPDDGYLKLRFRWPEQLVQPPGSDFRDWSFGVRTDPDDAETRYEYHFCYLDRPGEKGEIRDAQDVVHTMDRETDSGIKRGLPLFSFDCKDALEAASRLTRNLGEGSAIRAAIAFIRQHEGKTPEEITSFVTGQADFSERRPFRDTYQNVTDLQPGTVYDISEGMEFAGVPANAETAAHAAVCDLLVRSACSRINAPEWLGSSNAANMGAYTSSLVAESPFVKGVIGDQEYYRSRFMDVVNRALNVAATHGVIRPEDLQMVTVELVPPSPEVRNRQEEATIASIEIPLGVDSRQRYAEAVGRDFGQIEADNQSYQDKFGGDGQTLPMPGPDLPLSKLPESLLESGFTGTVKDSIGRERHYVDGKQVANPGGASGGTSNKSTGPTADHVTAGLEEKIAAAHPEEAKKPGLIAKAKDLAITAAAKGYMSLVSLTPAAMKVMSVLGDVFDTPQDLAKFGYNPTVSSGTANTVTADPVKAATGISTHLAMTIASHVLAKGVTWAKGRFGKTESEEGDGIMEAATAIRDCLAAIAAELGLPEPPDAKVFADAIARITG